jgi:hypothetical protein
VSERPILFSAPMVRAILAGTKTMTRRVVKNLRVQLRHEATSDLPGIIRPFRRYEPGTYLAGMNPQGAVHVIGEQGDLGIKPQEFDFKCPYADGHTYLRKYPDGRMLWHLQVNESRLWVRETWAYTKGNGHRVVFAADLGTDRWPAEVEQEGAKFRPSIHLRKCDHRIDLEVTGVRVERLQSITEEDATAEGMGEHVDPVQAFSELWVNLNGEESWTDNPWVWVVEFRRVNREEREG